MKQAIKFDSLKYEYYYAIGNVFREKLEIDSSLKYYNKAMTLNDTDFYILSSIGGLNYEMGNFEESCLNLNNSIDCVKYNLDLETTELVLEVKQIISRICDPYKSSYHFERGLFELDKLNYSDAITYFNEAIEINPESPFILINRGHANLAEGNFDSAITDFKLSLEMRALLRSDLRKELDNIGEPYDLDFMCLVYYSNIYSSLCEAYCGLKQYKEGLVFLHKSIDLLKRSYEPEAKVYLSDNYNFCGEIQWAIQDLGLAKSYFKRAIEVNPNNAVPFLNMAMLILEKQNVYTKNKEVVDYDAFFESVKNGSKMIVKTQKVKKRGKLLKAEKFCDKAIELNNEYGGAYFVRAQIKIILQEVGYFVDAKLAEGYGVTAAASILEVECK